MSTNKYIIYTVLLLYGSLSATNLGDFAGYWEGTESLSSPTMSFEGREVYISLRHNASLEENLLYSSNSDFIQALLSLLASLSMIRYEPSMKFSRLS